MSAVLTANWWTVALRGLAAIVFVGLIFLMPQPALASLVLLFAAYLAADGLFAIIAGARGWARRTLADAHPGGGSASPAMRGAGTRSCRSMCKIMSSSRRIDGRQGNIRLICPILSLRPPSYRPGAVRRA